MDLFLLDKPDYNFYHIEVECSTGFAPRAGAHLDKTEARKMASKDNLRYFLDCIARDDTPVFISSDGAFPQQADADLGLRLQELLHGPGHGLRQPCIAVGSPGRLLYEKSSPGLLADIFLAGEMRFLLLAGVRGGGNLARILVRSDSTRLLACKLNIVAIDRQTGRLCLAGLDNDKAYITSMAAPVGARGAAVEIRRDKEFNNLAALLAPFNFQDLLLAAPAGLWLRDPRAAAVAALKNSGKCHVKEYLARYPDIREAGMDPVRHYVMHGLAEGRIMNVKSPASSGETGLP